MTTKMKLLASALVLVPAVAFAAGVVTNGVPQVVPGTSYYSSNGQSTSLGNGNFLSLNTYSGELGGYELLPADTQLGSGAQPQSIAPTAFQVAAIAAAAAVNTGTATSNAISNNGSLGVANVTTASAVTPGSTYTLTLTDTSVIATSKVQIAAYLGVGAGTGGAVQVVSVTPASGSVVVVLKNTGTANIAAATGAIYVVWQIW